jgi:sigma-B regulation protein RsbQ
MKQYKCVWQWSASAHFCTRIGCDQNTWQYVVGYFTNNYKVILFDYTGSGGSDISQYKKKKYSHIDNYVQDLIEISNVL